MRRKFVSGSSRKLIHHLKASGVSLHGLVQEVARTFSTDGQSSVNAQGAATWIESKRSRFGLGEDNGFVAMDEDAILNMPHHRPGQHGALDLPTDAPEFSRAMPMVNTVDILFDDRAGIELIRHIVGGRADELDASMGGLGVWVCAGEGRQKAMVDVDDPVLPLFDERGRQYLHVSRQHDEIDMSV